LSYWPMLYPDRRSASQRCDATPRLALLPRSCSQLLRLFVRRVLPAVVAELAELQPLGRLLLVLGRDVVPVLAVRALENDVVAHMVSVLVRSVGSRPGHNLLFAVAYWMISVTVPAPTVLPPSLMANRSPFSMAMGAISSISICVLSPGITISVPAGRCATPVTSVVRK